MFDLLQILMQPKKAIDNFGQRSPAMFLMKNPGQVLPFISGEYIFRTVCSSATQFPWKKDIS